MKICVSASGNTIESNMDQRFGRAPYFIIADTDTMEYEAVENVAAVTGGGAGVASGQMMIDKGVFAVITGNLGPNAMNVLKAANIRMYHGEAVSVKENIKKYENGLLKKIEATAPSHYGMGFRGSK